MTDVEIVSNALRWQEVKDQCDSAVREARGSVYQTSAWLVPWWDYYGQGVRPQLDAIDYFGYGMAHLSLCLVWRGRTVIGFAPLYSHRRFRWKVETARCLRLLGGYHTDFVAVPGEENLVGELIAEALLRERIADAIYLWDVPVHSQVVNAFLAALRRHHAVIHERTCAERCTTVLPRTFEAFLAGLAANRRNDYRRATKASEQLGVTVDVAPIAGDPGASIDVVMESFLNLIAAKII